MQIALSNIAATPVRTENSKQGVQPLPQKALAEQTAGYGMGANADVGAEKAKNAAPNFASIFNGDTSIRPSEEAGGLPEKSESTAAEATFVGIEKAEKGAKEELGKRARPVVQSSAEQVPAVEQRGRLRNHEAADGLRALIAPDAAIKSNKSMIGPVFLPPLVKGDLPVRNNETASAPFVGWSSGTGETSTGKTSPAEESMRVHPSKHPLPGLDAALTVPDISADRGIPPKPASVMPAMVSHSAVAKPAAAQPKRDQAVTLPKDATTPAHLEPKRPHISAQVPPAFSASLPASTLPSHPDGSLKVPSKPLIAEPLVPTAAARTSVDEGHEGGKLPQQAPLPSSPKVANTAVTTGGTVPAINTPEGSIHIGIGQKPPAIPQPIPSSAEEMMRAAESRQIAKPDDVVVIQQVIRLKGSGPIAPRADVVNEASASSRLRTPLRADQTPAMTPPQPLVDTIPLGKLIPSVAPLPPRPDHIILPGIASTAVTKTPQTTIPIQQTAVATVASTLDLSMPTGPDRRLAASLHLSPYAGIGASPVLPASGDPLRASDRQSGGNLVITTAPRTNPRSETADGATREVPGRSEPLMKSNATTLQNNALTNLTGVQPRSDLARTTSQPTSREFQNRQYASETVYVAATKPTVPVSSLAQAKLTQYSSVTHFQPNAEGRSASLVSHLNDLSPLSRTDTTTATATAIQAQTTPVRADLAAHVARQIADVAQHMPSRPVEISLSPEELGRVRLSVSSGDAGLIVNVLAERPETLDLMRRHISTLEQEFRALGYADVSFSFEGRQQTQGEGDQRENRPSKTYAIDGATGVSDAAPSPRKPETDAGLDLRL